MRLSYQAILVIEHGLLAALRTDEHDILLSLMWALGEPAAATGMNCRGAVRRATKARGSV